MNVISNSESTKIMLHRESSCSIILSALELDIENRKIKLSFLIHWRINLIEREQSKRESERVRDLIRRGQRYQRARENEAELVEVRAK